MEFWVQKGSGKYNKTDGTKSRNSNTPFKIQKDQENNREMPSKSPNIIHTTTPQPRSVFQNQMKKSNMVSRRTNQNTDPSLPHINGQLR